MSRKSFRSFSLCLSSCSIALTTLDWNRTPSAPCLKATVSALAQESFPEGDWNVKESWGSGLKQEARGN